MVRHSDHCYEPVAVSFQTYLLQIALRHASGAGKAKFSLGIRAHHPVRLAFANLAV